MVECKQGEIGVRCKVLQLCSMLKIFIMLEKGAAVYCLFLSILCFLYGFKNIFFKHFFFFGVCSALSPHSELMCLHPFSILEMQQHFKKNIALPLFFWTFHQICLCNVSSFVLISQSLFHISFSLHLWVFYPHVHFSVYDSSALSSLLVKL